MAKYRKKPVVIEAVQFIDNAAEILEFCLGDARIWIKDEDGNMTLAVATIEGEIQARKNDWIIKGVKGEFYPCKPDIFEQTYEPVD